MPGEKELLPKKSVSATDFLEDTNFITSQVGKKQ